MELEMEAADWGKRHIYPEGQEMPTLGQATGDYILRLFELMPKDHIITEIHTKMKDRCIIFSAVSEKEKTDD